MTFEEEMQAEQDRYAALAEQLNGAGVDSLVSLIETGEPVFDGDIPSKSGRDHLIQLELASRAIYKGEYGYAVATYLGAYVYTYMFGGKNLAEAIDNRKNHRTELYARNKK